MTSKIIITGGLGYIGSHTIVELKDNVDEFIVIDDLSNSDISIIDRLYKITKKKIVHINESINNENKLKEIFKVHQPDSVMHFAGLKSVQEGELYPEEYFHTNVIGTECLLNALKSFGKPLLIKTSG